LAKAGKGKALLLYWVNCFQVISAPLKSMFSEAKIVFTVSNFIVAVDNFINVVAKI